MAHKGFCDNCERETRVARLKLSGSSGVFLCSPCWTKEMRYRKTRNKTLSREARFSIRKFPK